MTMPGFAATANKDLVDRIAQIELAIRNMQKTPRNAPVTTDLHLYGDRVSTGPRYMASGVSWGPSSSSGQVFSQYLGQMPSDMVFRAISMYTQTANAATAALGLYTGSSLRAMTLAGSEITVTLANSSVGTVTFPSPVVVPRETLVVVCLRLNSGATAPVFGALAPSGGGLSGLTAGTSGLGCSRNNTTGIAPLPASADFTTGYTAQTSNLWIALS